MENIITSLHETQTLLDENKNLIKEQLKNEKYDEKFSPIWHFVNFQCNKKYKFTDRTLNQII